MSSNADDYQHRRRRQAEDAESSYANAPSRSTRSQAGDSSYNQRQPSNNTGPIPYREQPSYARYAPENEDYGADTAPREADPRRHRSVEPARDDRDERQEDTGESSSRRGQYNEDSEDRGVARSRGSRNDDKPRYSRREPDYDDEPPRRRQGRTNDQPLDTIRSSRRPLDGDSRADLDRQRRREPEDRNKLRGYDGYEGEARRRGNEDDKNNSSYRRYDDDDNDEYPRGTSSRRTGQDREYGSRDRRDNGYTDSRGARERRGTSHDRRQDGYGSTRDTARSDRQRQYYSDDDNYERRRDNRREPRDSRSKKSGGLEKYIEMGQKHYKTLGPILTPILKDLATNYMSGKK